MLTIGESIRKARISKGYTISDLARKSGITFQTLFKWEKGDIYPNIFNLIPIADVLNISLDELVGRTVKDDERN